MKCRGFQYKECETYTKAIREALETALQTIRGIIDGTLARRNQSVFDCRDQLKAALSKPPRNCDVGSAEEQDDRMTLYCQTSKCETCPLWDNVNNGVRCEFTWAQMPYEKGATK